MWGFALAWVVKGTKEQRYFSISSYLVLLTNETAGRAAINSIYEEILYYDIKYEVF